jgi:hypothetical protein
MDAREVNVVQLQLLGLITPKECVTVPAGAQTELIALMARILVAVYHAEGGKIDDGVFVQSEDQTGAPGTQGNRVLATIERKAGAAEQRKPTPSNGPGGADASLGLERGRDYR